MDVLVRSYVAGALEDKKVKKVLTRYVKVVKDELPANFQIAERVVFDFDKSMNAAQLWTEHGRLMKKFHGAKMMIDKGKLKLEDLEIPRFSLLDLKVLLAKEILKECELCERRCRANRLAGERGECKVTDRSLISSMFMHMGEEPHISPSHTIFFMGCNFHCQYCQNWTISQWHETGREMQPEQIGRAIEEMKERGTRNVNWVGGSPTPNLLFILQSLKACEANQANIWNSNFYMTEKCMRLLDGIVDMYLSDFKYGNDACAERLSKVRGYFDICTRNHLIAAKQADLTIRHLVLPNHIECCTKPVLDWIAKNLRKKAIVNLMDQYRPEFKASEHKDISRRLEREEFEETVNYAKKLKLNYIF